LGLEKMTLSSDAVRQVEQDLLLKADVLSYYLSGLATTDAERAKAVYADIVARLRNAVSTETDFDPRADGSPSSDRRPTFRVASRSGGGDEIEDFILDNLANRPRGASVQDIVDDLSEAEIDIKRPTLVVRLHRLVQAGKLTSRTHGHYALSEAEHGRRQTA
jgi:hypothetical protein